MTPPPLRGTSPRYAQGGTERSAHRLGVDHHPRHAELVRDHAEAAGEEGLGDRHLNLPALPKRREELVGLGVAGGVDGEGDKIDESPTLMQACITLPSLPGGIIDFWSGGISLKCIIISTWAPIAPL
jgi:hypothetical protein